MLWSNHPNARAPKDVSLDKYCSLSLEQVQLDITVYTVTALAWVLLGGAGPVGIDLVSLQLWILNFGGAITNLWLVVMSFSEWLDNRWPPW